MTGDWLSKCMFALSKTEESTWLNAIDKEQAVNGIGRNKLRTCRLFKRTYKTEQYCLTRSPFLKNWLTLLKKRSDCECC